MTQRLFNKLIPSYSVKDLTAAIAVFLVAIPLCLGIAHASGAPLMSGILAGIIGGVVVGALSQSNLSVTGPAAGLVAIVIAGIAELGSYPAFLVATLLAGGVQVLMGSFRLGRFANLFPKSVIEGMLAGIGVIIVLKQYKVWIGATPELTYQTLAVGLGVLCIGLMLVWERFFSSKFKLIPASLVAVVACMGLNLLITSMQPSLALAAGSYANIPKIEGISHFFDLIPSPDWSALYSFTVYKYALIIAVVASLESLLCLNGIEAIAPTKGPLADKNRELIAQGAGNMLSGFLGALPVTSVIVRSSVNLNAGATSKVSTILHGLLLLVALFFGATFLSKIPLVALASILIFTGYKLAHPSRIKEFYQQGVKQFLPFATTLTVCVMQDLLMGIFAGVACYLALTLKFRPSTATHTRKA